MIKVNILCYITQIDIGVKEINLIKTNCHHCGKEIFRKRWVLKKYPRSACSRKCQDLMTVKKINTQCSYCGVPIIRTAAAKKKSKTGMLFCSLSHASKVTQKNRTDKIKKSIAFHCKCGNKMDRKSARCRSCHFKHKYGNLHGDRTMQEEWDRVGRIQMHTNVREHARAIFRKSGKPKVCQECGYSKFVQICHIKPVGSFDKNTLIEVVNDISNLIALCPNHHWELEHGLIDPGGAAPPRTRLSSATTL